MEEKTVLADLLAIKQQVEHMDLLEFKLHWDQHGRAYPNLGHLESLEYTVMSVKILQAKVDLIRTFSSIKECSLHPEPQKATYYYLRANLWKFLDNFRYILLVDDITDQVKLDGLALLNEVKELIAQDEQLKTSCVERLHKLLAQVKTFENDALLRKQGVPPSQLYQPIAQRLAQLLDDLEPQAKTGDFSAETELSPQIQRLLQTYAAFSVSRISIEKSGVLSIIQLLHDYPPIELGVHKTQLQQTLTTLEHEIFQNPGIRSVRNQCAYALVILMEMLKMHNGLPVLLLKIIALCGYLRFPPPQADLARELHSLKGRITNISQKKLRPIIEDVLWKSPEYFLNLPHLRTVCSWGWQKSTRPTCDLSYIQRVASASFDRLGAPPQLSAAPEAVATSRLSKTVIEILGLLVNLEPSPQFLKLHAREALLIKQAKDLSSQPSSLEKLLDKQYNTYRNHLKFLQDSMEYYQGILEKLGQTAE